MKAAFRKTLAVSLMLSIAFPAQIVGPALAEDIDIYAADTGTATNPNILVVIDNSANWSAANQHWPNNLKQGQSELNSLRTVISELGSDVNLGLMMFTPGSGSAIDGGYVRYHVRQMTATNKAAFQEMLGNPSGCTDAANSLNGTPNCLYQNFDAPSEKVGTAKTDYSAAMFDVFKYFGGYTSPANALANTAGTPVDASHFGALRYAGNPETNSDAAAYGTTVPSGYAGSCDNKGCYNPPLSSTNSCAKNYVVFIGNGYPTQDSSPALLTGVGGSATALSVPDLTTTTTSTPTLLATSVLGAYASQAACETAAAATYGAAYNSYSCTVASSNTTTATTALAATSCGQYADAAACSAAETTANSPTYDSVSCTVLNANCGGTTTLADSACNEFASQAACQAQTTVGGTTYNSVACTQKAGNCSYPETASGTSSCRVNTSSCVANGSTDLPGYTSYSCGATLTAGCTATGTVTVCASSAANCTANQATSLPGYTSYTTSYTNNNCVPNVGGSKQCVINGTSTVGNTYAISGSRSNASGISYSRVGAGLPTSTFNRTGSKATTQYSYAIYGNTTVTAATATGTFSGTSGNYADEWARFLNQTDVSSATGKQGVSTYTIDVFKDAQDANETKLLMSMARAGGGKYFSATNEEAIKNALRQIFSEIQSVNSVFASSSLPVSVNTQGTYLNQVFMGMFRPDGGSKPRWFGNLKQYQFKIFDTLKLADKNGDQAISSTTGFITPCADSFWTTDSGTYWNYGGSNATGSCTAQTSTFPAAGSSSAYSDAPDGDVVEKGGAAQRLRGVGSSGGTLVSTATRYALCAGGDTPATASCRLLKTCDGSTSTSCTALTSFDTSNTAALTAAAFGVADDATKNNLVNWVRGQDLDDENGNNVTTEMRPSAHGGVVHSQPAVVDFGGTTGVVTFYGGDEGVLHAVDGGKTDSEGVELWGFIAPETFGRLNRLKLNSPLINFPGVSMALTPTPTAKNYFFDGSIGVYQSGATVWIYPTMRRGGRAIYAFDVSTPASPTIKWRKGCFTNSTSDDSSCSTGWSAIGQTWSKPQVATLNGYGTTPVLVFGGGYDSCEDTDSQTRCAGTRKGAGIWFVNADTGALLRYYPTHYSVPGDVTLLKDASGNITYVYAADTGGYVYRINVGTYDGTAFTDWSGNSAATDIDIAYLSEPTAVPPQQRKFLYGPSVVVNEGFNAVLLGSGDREHPLLTNYPCADPVTNEFFMLKDTPTAYAANIAPGDLYNVTGLAAPLQATLDATQGWLFSLSTCEQVVNRALTIGGTTYFGTNAPTQSTPGTCSTNLGTARGYAVDFLSGTGNTESTIYVGGGLPPSPVGGVVDIDGQKQPFCIGCTPPGTPSPSPLEGNPIDISPTGARYRVYWYLKTD